MKVKTYGVQGLTEWHGRVKAGSIEVSVSFTGGTASPSGAQPAYMVTKDPITQFVIEHSKEYNSGFIFLSMEQELPGEHRRMAVPKAVAEPSADAKGTTANEPSGDAEGTTAKEPADVSAGTEQAGAEPVAEGVQTIEVSCRADAVEWLKEHNPDKGYNGNTLRSKDAFAAACQESGVEFIIANA